MPPLLSIKNLSISFNLEGQSTEVVRNISLEVNSGEMLAVVGESGSGKSVTALSVLQLLPTQTQCKGKILFSGRTQNSIDILGSAPEILRGIRGRDIAMIFQEPMSSLNPVLTCGRQVMEAIQLHLRLSKVAAKKRVLELFELVRLPFPEEILRRYPHQLSGGQKQRVMIAMAMSCNPSLLIADEPTTALDVTVQKTILALIRELQKKQQMGVILITHDLGVVSDIADRIAVMYKGEIVEQGEAREILQQPKHPYTRALLACRPGGQSKGRPLPVVSDFVEGNSGNQGRSVVPAVNALSPDRSGKAPPLVVTDLRVSFPVKKDFFGKTIQSFNAVDGVSFTISKGEIVGLVGESGCGKTSLGRAVLQLIKAESGKILVNGKDISQVKAAALRKIRKNLQIVFQDPYGSLNPRISIGDAILEPLKVHSLLNSRKERKEKVIALLEKVSLVPDHFNRYPHQFSGGQRQRICIARALATEPSFLVFDESVSALDVSVQAQVLNLLNELKNEFGFTALFISHNLSVVYYLCNRIMVMHKGRIIEEGTAEQVYKHPKNEYTQNLIDAIPGKSIVPQFG